MAAKKKVTKKATKPVRGTTTKKVSAKPAVSEQAVGIMRTISAGSVPCMSTAGRALGGLKRRGWVASNAKGDLRLTADGKKALKAIDPMAF